jgi:putative redox protein
MAKRVTTSSGPDFRVRAGNGTSEVVLDMAAAEGGGGRGLDPHETLLAALGGCTTMTLLSYARRKAWPLEGVDLDLAHEKPPVAAGDAPSRVTVRVALRGPLDEAQRARLMEIATKCPVYRTLTGEIAIEETLAAAGA